MKLTKLVYICGIMSLLAGSASWGELILNPGFEDNNPADGSFGDDWGSYGATAFLDFFPNGNPGHGTFFADNEANDGGIFQQGIAGLAATLYAFSVDASFESNWDANVYLGLEFYQNDDSTQIDAFYSQLVVQPGAGYERFSIQATAPAGTAFVRPIVMYDTVTSVDGSSEAGTFDNASLTVVPEPTTGVLVVLALAIGSARRSFLRRA